MMKGNRNPEHLGIVTEKSRRNSGTKNNHKTLFKEEDIDVSFTVCACIGFLVFSVPFAVLLSVLLNCKKQLSFRLLVPFVVASFALTHMSRDLGVRWDNTSRDDIPNYLTHFTLIDEYGLLSLVKGFIGRSDQFVQMEPLYNLYVYCLKLATLGNPGLFLLTTFLLIGILICLISYNLSNRYWMILVGFHLFLFLGVWAQTAHILRYSIANYILILGVVLFFKNLKIAGSLFLWSAPFVHLGTGLHLMVFVVFAAIERLTSKKQIGKTKKIFGLKQKILYSLAVGILIMSLPILAHVVAPLMYSVGITKVLRYIPSDLASSQDAYAHMGLGRLIRASFYGIIFLLGGTFLKINKFSLYLVSCYIVTLFFGFMYSQSYGTFSRLLEFATINIAWAVGLALLITFRVLLVGTAFFAAWSVRLILILYILNVSSELTVWHSLAGGNFLSPFNGILQMIFTGPELWIQATDFTR